jgi:putative redox protein
MTANIVHCETETAGGFQHALHIRAHTLHADASVAGGGSDAAPNPHDYFDAALAACKAITAQWYARKHGIPLERVDTRVERDDADERKGIYRLRLRVELHGPLSDEQRQAVLRAIAACPVHKLMTTTDVQIETVP